MYCKHCGKQIDDRSKFCPSCGGNVTDAVPMTSEQPVRRTRQVLQDDKGICCPYCGGTYLELSTRSDRSGLERSGMERCWACLDCGYKFLTPEELRNKAYSMNKRKNVFKVMTVISVIVLIALMVAWVFSIADLMDNGRDFDEAFVRFWKSKDMGDFYIRVFSFLSLLYVAVSILGLTVCGRKASDLYTEYEHMENSIRYAKERNKNESAK